MAGLPKRPCRHPGCTEYALDRRRFCARHQAEYENKRKRDSRARNGRPEWDALYRTKRWSSLKAQQLRRQPLCEECLRHGVVAGATDVDHIVPHRGDSKLFHDPKNHQSLCHRCHSSKTAREDGGFGNRVLANSPRGADVKDDSPAAPRPLRF